MNFKTIIVLLIVLLAWDKCHAQNNPVSYCQFPGGDVMEVQGVSCPYGSKKMGWGFQ